MRAVVSTAVLTVAAIVLGVALTVTWTPTGVALLVLIVCVAGLATLTVRAHRGDLDYTDPVGVLEDPRTVCDLQACDREASDFYESPTTVDGLFYVCRWHAADVKRWIG